MVDDPAERDRLAVALDAADDDYDYICVYISEAGRVLGCKLNTGERVIYEGEIQVRARGEGWDPIGEPRLYRVTARRNREHDADARRLFLTHSFAHGSVRAFTGWRERVVALIPEEVGAKEAKVMRTLANGHIEVTHTYNVLDAYGTYAGWVHDLAMEFGSTDEVIVGSAGRPRRPSDEQGVRHIIQAWLMRDAAEAELAQARHSLKFGLGAHARMLRMPGGPALSIAELARSLYTDRANLARVINAADRDARITRFLDAIESDDRNRISGALRAD
jgi:hypothetical protein